MKVAVKDANILIDLIEADLIGLWFRLGIETYTTDLVRFEIRRPSQRQVLDRFVEAGMLRVEAFEADGLDVVSQCAREHHVSIADASALLLAQKLGAALLSGDSALRTAAKAAGVDVRGLVWVFDRLLEAAVLSHADAAAKMKHLLEGESFLPQAVCWERIRAWEATARNK